MRLRLRHVGTWMLALAGLATACVEESTVDILTPERGSMLPAGQDVVVTVRVKADGAEVGDQPVGHGTHEVTLPPADGLGFVTARVPGEALLAVRSWHQGAYREAHDWNADTLGLRLGDTALAGDATSNVTVAGLIADLLTDEELEGFVPDPLHTQVTVTIPFVGNVAANVDISVTSAISDDVTLHLFWDDTTLRFAATLRDLPVAFSATAPAYSLSCQGTAVYDTVSLTGTVGLTAEAVTLTDVQSSTVGPDITCAGQLPLSEDLPPVAALLEDEVPPALAQAAQNAADAVFPQLLAQLRPALNIAFAEPIAVTTEVASLETTGGGLLLSYDSQVEAQTSSVATADQGVLERLATDTVPDASDVTASVGSALVNQLAFALWDAGNFSSLTFTKAELESLGMPELDFPYSHLTDVTITLLLPPLLEWDESGPRLDLGGIELLLRISGSQDSTAWTAASVPVRLVPDPQDPDHALRLEPDPTRALVLRDVGFDRMSKLVDQDKVLRLLTTAVPGVVTAVFGDLPTLLLQPIGLTRLDGSDGPVVQPRLTGVSQGVDTWHLALVLALASP